VNFIQWAISPWGQRVPVHIAWDLLWVAAISGLLFLIVHAIYVGYWAKPETEPSVQTDSKLAAVAARLPEHVARHSAGARMFHWIMAASMLVLLFTAFLPKVGVKFAWVKIHWIAGVVLIVSVLYHIIHATFVLDFWSIWPNKEDIDDAAIRVKRAMGENLPAPKKFGKYPLENKLYHLAVLFAGLSAIITGIFMMSRVRTPFFTRNPYLFGDETWGLMYVLHGFAGVGFVALIITHIYFAVRPEKLFLTKSMIFGWITRQKYIEHHDPERWPVGEDASKPAPSRSPEVVT
jgi:cytochrome b subunit of formate dehydrogenase